MSELFLQTSHKIKRKEKPLYMTLGNVVYATTQYVYDISRQGKEYLLLQQIIKV